MACSADFWFGSPLPKLALNYRNIFEQNLKNFVNVQISEKSLQLSEGRRSFFTDSTSFFVVVKSITPHPNQACCTPNKIPFQSNTYLKRPNDNLWPLEFLKIDEMPIRILKVPLEVFLTVMKGEEGGEISSF